MCFVCVGYYMYFEATGVTNGATSIIQGPLVTATKICFTFWYNMYGATMGALSLEYFSSSDGDISRTLWSQANNQGTEWKQAKILIDSSQPFYVSFKILPFCQHLAFFSPSFGLCLPPWILVFISCSFPSFLLPPSLGHSFLPRSLSSSLSPYLGPSVPGPM